MGCTLSWCCRHVWWVCVFFSPVKPDEICCAWPGAWSHLTAGTSAGWWELCRARHAHINEIIWSVDSRLPAEACGSSLLSFVCIFIKVDNENTGGGGGAFNTKSSPSQAFIEENKTYKKNQNKLLTSSNTSWQNNTPEKDKHIYCFNLPHFFLSPVLFHGMLLSPPGGEGRCHSGN